MDIWKPKREMSVSVNVNWLIEDESDAPFLWVT